MVLNCKENFTKVRISLQRPGAFAARNSVHKVCKGALTSVNKTLQLSPGPSVKKTLHM